jgi:hypothetical protein
VAVDLGYGIEADGGPTGKLGVNHDRKRQHLSV